MGASVSACMGVCVRGCVRVCVNACWAKSRMYQSHCSGAEFAFWAKGWWPKEGQEVAFWYFLWEITFNSLNQLMDYHRTSSISRIETVYLKDMLPMVTAEYDFEPQEDGELRLRKGDIVSILDMTDTNWWHGICNSREGVFPVP